MTIQQVETILQGSGISIAVQQRFAFDTGTLLRLDNYAIINVFDDGRYFIQGANTGELIPKFTQIEQPWDPESWDGKVPGSGMHRMLGL